MDELVGGEVECGEPGEGGQEGGGDIVQFVMSQTEIGQIGQNSIKWSAPPYYVRK